MLAVFWGLVLFYAVVAYAVFNPRTDDDYRRTYVTREFGVYPPSAFFEGRNGLTYEPGTVLDMTKSTARLHLNRFDWIWQGGAGPGLDRYTGRIFVHLRPELEPAQRAHVLKLDLVCAFPDGVSGRFTVSLNGAPIGAFVCAETPGPFVFEAMLPPGSIGIERYDEIRIGREPENWSDRAATILGRRIAALQLAAFEIEPLDDERP